MNFEEDSSLYNSIFQGNKKIQTTSVFSDTHTYFGFNEKLISSNSNNKYVQNFIKYVKDNDVKLQTQIEWHVKPGHILKLVETLKKNKKISNTIDLSCRKLILGKSDYLLQELNDNILTNYFLILEIHKNNDSKLFEHARKVRSYVYFDIDENEILPCGNENPLFLENEMEALSVSSSEFYKTNEDLKQLKISRQIRNKILKIFSNYNNGIQDPILFPYFLDFTIFIKKNVFDLIENKKSNINSTLIYELEEQLDEHIKVFQEGYDDRFLNSYQFENISDFDLDFNSSIQQLLTGYNTLVSEYVKLFYDKTSNNSPIVQLNNNYTTSNHLSINYSVHHLTSPEFVFSTILKEILNNIRTDDDDYAEILEEFKKNLPDNLSGINESYLDDMFERKQVDINNFIIDCIRYIITFNCDFKLFTHWFWSYNFQNSSLYNSNGMFNEDFLKMEMLRLKMVERFFNIDDIVFEWSVPELYVYWKRHKKKINVISKKLDKILDRAKFEKLIGKIVNNYLESYEKIESVTGIENPLQLKKYSELSRKVDFINEKNNLKRLMYLFSKNAKSQYNIHKVEKKIFETLLEHYTKCDEKIIVLKRDWETGEPLKKYFFLIKDSFYAVDQTGGVFFYDTEKCFDYFKMTVDCLLGIIDFSLKEKKSFILNYLNG